jgi:hypothetical protein
MQEIIKKLLDHVKENCTPVDREKRFSEMLDECYSFEKVGGPFEHMSPAKVLEEMDPIAFRCGVNDFGDGEGWIEVEGSDYVQDEVEKAKEEFMEELERKESDLSAEIDKMEADEDHDLEDLGQLKRDLHEVESDIQSIKSHSF